MNNDELLYLRGLDIKIERILNILADSEKSKASVEKVNKIEKRWITLTEAVSMMGSYSLSSVRARPDLQPCLGHGTKVGRNKCWTKDEIIEWLNSVNSPQARKAYQQKYARGRNDNC